MDICRTTDYETLAKLNKPIQDLHASLYPDRFREYNFEAARDTFAECVKDPQNIFLLLRAKEEAIGYAWAEFRIHRGSAFTVPRKSLFIHQIAIIESKRGRGYGSALMGTIYELARGQGADIVELDYWANNQGAKSFYKSEGFQPLRAFVYRSLS